MSTLRENRIFKLFFFLMALHIFNICIDNEDFEVAGMSEDLSFNDQETVVEFILETLLGFEDAIAEHDEPDTDRSVTLDAKKVQLYFTELENFGLFASEFKRKPIAYYNEFYFNVSFDITPPPPKA